MHLKAVEAFLYLSETFLILFSWKNTFLFTDAVSISYATFFR